MSRKRRKMLILIISIIVIVLIMAITFVLLYINTDLFKSNATLFAKYIGENLENVDSIYETVGTNEYDELLQQNKYTTQTEIKVNYIENKGTTAENTQNSVNQLKLQINGQTDANNQYQYQDINLLKEDNKITEIEYIKKENTYGLRFSDLFNQYILVNNENLKELFQKLGYNEEQLENIPESIEINNNLKEIFELSKEEKQDIQTKYKNIINSNVTKQNFSSQKNQTIQIDGKNITANAYILTLSKEQMNTLYIKILEQLKQDEIILKRLDQFQALYIEESSDQSNNLRQQFIKNIEELISTITRNNIGKEEEKIIVYENKGKTIKTIFKNLDNEINIDWLSLEAENYAQISYQDESVEQVLTYKDTNEETNIIYKDTEDEITKEYSLVINEKINDKNKTKNIVLGYKDDTNQVEATIAQKFDLVDYFQKEVTLNEENSINLSELTDEQLSTIWQKISDGVSQKTMDIMTNQINRRRFVGGIESNWNNKARSKFGSNGNNRNRKK